jgi:hypothetical protein
VIIHLLHAPAVRRIAMSQMMTELTTPHKLKVAMFTLMLFAAMC